MSTGKPAQKGPNILGAISDFLILVLMLAAAGGGGYYWGTIQRMAPVKLVAPGTPGAIPAESSASPGAKPGGETASVAANSASGKDKESNNNKDSNAEKSTGKDTSKSKDKQNSSSANKDSQSEEESSSSKKSGKLDYWISSSGSDYIGYSVTVSVNGKAVDSFFGPDKTVDITKLVKSGENSITFDSKNMGSQYNKHKGDGEAVLTLQLVSGPFQTSNFKSSDVILTYNRNASESEDFKDTKHFTKD